MPCDTMRQPRQTLAERIAEISAAIADLDARLKKRLVKVKVGPQGAIAFDGWPAEKRNGITDACAFRRLMVTGSALARAEIARAEQIAGRQVDRAVVGRGVHSHDGGATWHGKG